MVGCHRSDTISDAGRNANRQGLITQRVRFAVGGGVIGRHILRLLTIDLELFGGLCRRTGFETSELVKTLLGAAKREELIGAKKAQGKVVELGVEYCRKVT